MRGRKGTFCLKSVLAGGEMDIGGHVLGHIRSSWET